MAEEQKQIQPKSKREQFGERLKKKYPDKEYADDEALFGQINDDYDAYDNELGEYKQHEQELGDMFAADPRSAHFLSSWHRGEHPMTAFIREFGKEGLEELINNDEKQEEFARANEEYWARQADAKKQDDEYEQNLKESMSVIEQYQSEKGLSDEQMDAAVEFLFRIANDGAMGKVSRESLDMALNAVNHDTDVQAARTEGTVAGRNQKIDEKLRKPKSGDGQPNLAGSNNAPSQGRKPMSIFDYADAAR